MRIANVVGRVTLSVRHPRIKGERLMLVLPWKSCDSTTPQTFDPSIIAYDEFGASPGQQVAVCEGREAACPFTNPTPVDAYVGALLDEVCFPKEIK